MRYSTTTIVMAALSIAEVVVAGPTHAHLHRHRDVHAKKDVDWAALDWDNMGIDWSKAWEEGQHKSTSAPAPVATTSAVKPAVLAEVPATTTAPVVVSTPSPTTVAASSSSSSSASPSASSSSDLGDAITSIVTTLWSDIKGLADDLTEFGAATSASGSVIGKIGNIGSPECSNMIKVSSVGSHAFTNTFINTSKKAMTIAVWNKAASQDGTVEANLGSCIAPKTPCLSITLAAGEQQIVAFQDDTQAGWAEATSHIAASGAYATTWAEVNYASSGSGYDVSAIMNVLGNVYDMEMTATEVTCVSNMSENMWIAKDNNPEDPVPVGSSDGSCYVPGSTMTLTTKMGGSTV